MSSGQIEIYKNYDLSKNSSLRIKANAEQLVKPKSIQELIEIFKWIKASKLSWNILGAGSNLLLSSRAIHGVTVLMTALDLIQELEPGLFELGAGVKMPRFCAYASQKSYQGTEFMEGIPGTIGGGVVMNAGAHGSSIERILEEATILNLETLALEMWTKTRLEFTYRHSALDPSRYLLLSAKFRLSLGDKDEIRQKVIANNQHRAAAQPIKAWTCGSTFKNPSPELRAGILIQELGAKGWTEGDIRVSMQHGNFFENTKEGEGTSMDFCKLMARVQQAAWIQRSVLLEPEVQRIGEFSPEEDLIWKQTRASLSHNGI